jgi:hypothetical protein
MKKDKSAHRYKEKKCPMCGLLHRKRHQCCSLKCGIEYRSLTPPTEEAIRSRAEGVKRWKQTDAGEAVSTNLKQFQKDEELMVVPPEDIYVSMYIEDGDVWTSVD